MVPFMSRMYRGPFDEIATPADALNYLLPYLPASWTVWECAPGEGKLARMLEARGYRVVTTNDFLNSKPQQWDCIVTNPPFSKKAIFLSRCREFDCPWALLLPITTLGARKCQRQLEHAEIIFLPHRIDFTGKKAPWFSVAWFTYGLSIGRQLVFADPMPERRLVFTNLASGRDVTGG